jgi:hypothetical protein
MKWGEESTRRRASAGETEKVMQRIDSASSERERVAIGGMRRGGATRWAAATRGEPRRVMTSGGLVWAESA